MDTGTGEMIQLLIQQVESKEVAAGLKAALEIYSYSGYYNLNDWESLTQEEKRKEAESFVGKNIKLKAGTRKE